MEDNIKCPKCGNIGSVGHGSNLTQKWGNRKRRQCKKCATTFYSDWQEKTQEVI